MSEENDKRPTPVLKTTTVNDEKLQALLKRNACGCGCPYSETPEDERCKKYKWCWICWHEYLKG